MAIFDENEQPLAERLVFRNRRKRLNVKIAADKPEYSPLSSTTERASSAGTGLVLSFADDQTGHLLTLLRESRWPCR